ncbi:hypothetical protein AVEN_198658-1 [Araneus ventricosus]|uniref:Uncharacterized protein n=1 Tax=Araneus ventricosus TaxID=182803 RepID=A0A4Y2L643_ARAVE|nr:hypothetical protein AVEN_198658-1 [Araneus ventricosus]
MATSGSYPKDRLILIRSKFEESPWTAWNCELEPSAATETGTASRNGKIRRSLKKYLVFRTSLHWDSCRRTRPITAATDQSTLTLEVIVESFASGMQIESVRYIKFQNYIIFRGVG